MKHTICLTKLEVKAHLCVSTIIKFCIKKKSILYQVFCELHVVQYNALF